MKTCNKCKIEKPFEAFGKHGITKDGLRTQCRCCVSAYNRSKVAKAAQKTYRNTDKGVAASERRKNSDRRRAYLAAYNNSPERVAYMKAYNSRPEYVELKRQRDATAERLQYHRDRRPASQEWEIKKHLPHTMYLIRFTQGNRTYIKVGLTGGTTEKRFANDVHHSRMNNLEILDVITFKDFETCNIAESIIHDATLDSHVTPVIAFGGSVNECRLPEATEQILSMFESARAAMDN